MRQAGWGGMQKAHTTSRWVDGRNFAISIKNYHNNGAANNQPEPRKLEGHKRPKEDAKKHGRVFPRIIVRSKIFLKRSAHLERLGNSRCRVSFVAWTSRKKVEACFGLDENIKSHHPL